MSLFSALCLSASNALGVDSQCDAVPDNIVANCGFETGAFPPQWSCEPASAACRVNSHDVHSGFFAMEADGCISQTLTTVPDQSYDLSYWIPSYAWGGEEFDFTVSWNHEVITRLEFFLLQPYMQFGVQGLIGTGADTLTFCGDIYNYYWYIDDIVVTPSPETSR